MLLSISASSPASVVPALLPLVGLHYVFTEEFLVMDEDGHGSIHESSDNLVQSKIHIFRKKATGNLFTLFLMGSCRFPNDQYIHGPRSSVMSSHSCPEG